MVKISRYSPKCDFCDYIDMLAEDEGTFLKIYDNIYVGHNIVPLRLRGKFDLIPYYPFTVKAVALNNVYLGEESYVDEHERECLDFLNQSAISYWRKLKKAKTRFGEEELANHIAWGFSPQSEHITEISRRVMEHGEKANINGIHIASYEFYRDNLYNAMVKANWDIDVAYRWCYGFSRWQRKVNIC